MLNTKISLRCIPWNSSSHLSWKIQAVYPFKCIHKSQCFYKLSHYNNMTYYFYNGTGLMQDGIICNNHYKVEQTWHFSSMLMMEKRLFLSTWISTSLTIHKPVINRCNVQKSQFATCSKERISNWLKLLRQWVYTAQYTWCERVASIEWSVRSQI